jgi:transposase-like protein
MRKNELGERPVGRDELARWYAEALAEQASSGLSVAEYAEAIGVTASTLYQWRRRLAEGEGAGRARSPFGLVEVAIEDDRGSVEAEAEHLVIRLEGGRRIEVPADFDDAELRRLVRVLESC